MSYEQRHQSTVAFPLLTDCNVPSPLPPLSCPYPMLLAAPGGVFKLFD